MPSYGVRRAAQAIPVIASATVATFAMIHMIPGDPAAAILGSNATPFQLQQLRESLRLDEPIVVQYGTWLADAVRGDLGVSPISHEPVVDLLLSRIPATIQLTIAAIAIALIIAIPLSLVAAGSRSRVARRVASTYSSLALAVPSFWTAVMIILVFGLLLGWLPTRSDYIPFFSAPVDSLRNLAGPALTLGIFMSAVLSRFLYTSLESTLRSDYVRTARAKGVPRPVILMRHALRNAALPTLTVLGLQTGMFMGGAVITESVFSYPGIGLLAFRAVLARDLVIVQGVVLFVIVAFTLINLVVDLLYSQIDPRLRLQ